MEIQKRYIEEQTQNIFKLVASDGRLAKLLQRANERALKANEKLNTVKRYQAFYTPVNIIKKSENSLELIYDIIKPIFSKKSIAGNFLINES